MQQSILEALLHTVGEAAFVGIYAKGSSIKPWDSLLDYVPELSDVDIQLVLHDPLLLNNLELSLEVQSQIERRFFARVPQPLHLPRPQIQVINRFLSSKTFSPSPGKTVRTLFGKPYPEVHPLEDPRSGSSGRCVWLARAHQARRFGLFSLGFFGQAWQISNQCPTTAFLAGWSNRLEGDFGVGGRF